jgi:hypothetical protein
VINVEKYEGQGADRFYHVASKEQKQEIVFAQVQVKRIKQKWAVFWFGMFSLPAVILLYYGLPLWIVLLILGGLEIIAYSEFQNRYYKIVHAGGPRTEIAQKTGQGASKAILFVVALVTIYEMSQLNILGAEEWGNDAFIAIVVLGFILAFAKSLPRPIPKRKEVATAVITPPVEKPEDLLPEVAVRKINDLMVPSDVLGPGGRYFCVYNWWLRLDIATIKMFKMDTDVTVTAMCKDGSEGILNVSISGERPISNPVHLIESFKVSTVEDVKGILDNLAKTASRKIIGAVEKIEDLLVPDADYTFEALKTIVGSGINESLLNDLQDPAIDSHIYVPQMSIELNTAAINVEPSDKTKEQLLKKKKEQTDREAEMYEIETLAQLVFDLMERMEKKGKPISQEEAMRVVQSERGKIQSIDFKTNPNIDSIVNRLINPKGSP